MRSSRLAIAATSSSLRSPSAASTARGSGSSTRWNAHARDRRARGSAQLGPRGGRVGGARRPRVLIGDVALVDDVDRVDLEDAHARAVAVPCDRVPARPAPQQHRHRAVGDAGSQALWDEHQSAATLPWMNDSLSMTFGPSVKG